MIVHLNIYCDAGTRLFSKQSCISTVLMISVVSNGNTCTFSIGEVYKKTKNMEKWSTDESEILQHCGLKIMLYVGNRRIQFKVTVFIPSESRSSSLLDRSSFRFYLCA